MTKKVNINGQEIELEQCVIDGDELGNYTDITSETYYELPDAIFKSREVVEVPESEEKQFIREYIESDLNNQSNDDIFDRVLEDLSNKEPEVLPSYLDFTQFLAKKRNDEILKGNSKLIELEILAEEIQEEIDDIIEEYRKEYLSEYTRNYRKELREWWFKRRQNNGK